MEDRRWLCSLRQPQLPPLPADLNPNRERAILQNRTKWAAGTVLHYYFFDRSTDGRDVVLPNGTTEWRPWSGSDAEKNVVRDAFAKWRDVGIGLDTDEVANREQAEIRIGFEAHDGAWSYIGREILTIGRDERTMNFGWPLSSEPRELDTALHEIGHTLGLPHEHQNPFSGIVWDENAVYAALGGPPNRWDRDTTYHNIIRKLSVGEVSGSNWDPDSVMHYPFEAGMIKEPERYAKGLNPKGGLSDWDKTYVRSFYPIVTDAEDDELTPLQSQQLRLSGGEQANFRIRPPETRNYSLGTFGASDVVLVLFEEVDGRQRYVAGDDDSAQARNARLEVKLFKDRRYTLRVRLFYAERAGEVALMMW